MSKKKTPTEAETDETTIEDVDAELLTRNVVPFPGVTKFDAPVKSQPNTDAIELLETYLAAARAGNLQEVAFALVWDDNMTNYSWASQGSHALTTAIFDLMHEHGMHRAKARRDKDPDYDDEDPPDLTG